MVAVAVAVVVVVAAVIVLLPVPLLLLLPLLLLCCYWYCFRRSPRSRRCRWMRTSRRQSRCHSLARQLQEWERRVEA